MIVSLGDVFKNPKNNPELLLEIYGTEVHYGTEKEQPG
jgi:hypothetical protein